MIDATTIDQLTIHQLFDMNVAHDPVIAYSPTLGPRLHAHHRQRTHRATRRRASGSVSTNTTVLITAETTTAKAKKAGQLGVPIIDPAEFADMLAG